MQCFRTRFTVITCRMMVLWHNNVLWRKKERKMTNFGFSVLSGFKLQQHYQKYWHSQYYWQRSRVPGKSFYKQNELICERYMLVSCNNYIHATRQPFWNGPNRTYQKYTAFDNTCNLCVCACSPRDLGNGTSYYHSSFARVKSFSWWVAQVAWRVPHSNA